MELDNRIAETARATHRGVVAFAIGILTLGLGAAEGSERRIFSCVDATGKRLNSDRPILECIAREQRVLNSDGSVRKVVPPVLTADEAAQVEAREREAAAERVARQDAIRRDRTLLSRYPDEAAHGKSRAAALDDVRKSVANSEARVTRLGAERKALVEEAEFYVGKALPAKLKGQLDANDAALAAQRSLIQNQQLEMLRINELYNSELARLRKLWAGAPPGSFAAPSSPQTAAAVTSAAELKQ